MVRKLHNHRSEIKHLSLAILFGNNLDYNKNSHEISCRVQVLGFVTAPKFFKQDGGVILSDGGSLSLSSA